MNATMPLNIVNESYTVERLGYCYVRENYTVLVEGIHSEDTLNDFSVEYLKKNPRGQGNSYRGFKVRDDGNTEVYFSHLIDSGD